MNVVEEPLDELYFQWLYRQVGKGGTNRSKTHWGLLKQLYQKEFVWITPNDDNRIVEGIELRWEFVNYSDLAKVDAAWMNEGCSVLEMVMALTRRLTFEAEGEPTVWFWLLLKNLGLDEFTDENYEAYVDTIDGILDRLIWRQYAPDGRGGLFPLKSPQADQRQVEIWYQMAEYLYENTN